MMTMKKWLLQDLVKVLNLLLKALMNNTLKEVMLFVVLNIGLIFVKNF